MAEPHALIPEVERESADAQMRRWYEGDVPFLRPGFPEDILKLHPALRPYVQVTPELGTSLRHPFHYQVMGVNWRMANDLFEHKVQQIAEARAAGNWYLFLKLHERPYRLTTLADLWDSGTIDRATLNELLGDMWADAEYPSQHGKQLLLRLFKAAGYITDAETILPDEVTIYRGQPIGEKPGLSWTTDIDMGAWFARRYRDEATALLLRGHVRRDKVLAYLEGRGEHEVVVNPRSIRDVTTIALPPVTRRSRASRGVSS